MKNILPTNLSVSPPQNQDILMHIPSLRTPERRRPERPIPHDLQFHTTPHGLRNPIRPTQRLHLHGVLGLAPGRQTGFERVCGGRDVGCGGGRGRTGGGLGCYLVAEGVGETRGRGGAFGGTGEGDRDFLAGGCVGGGGAVVGRGCDFEGLYVVSLLPRIDGVDIFEGLLLVVVVVVVVRCWVRTMMAVRIEASYYFVREFKTKISKRQQQYKRRILIATRKSDESRRPRSEWLKLSRCSFAHYDSPAPPGDPDAPLPQKVTCPYTGKSSVSFSD